MIQYLTRKELKTRIITDFLDGDVLVVEWKYFIHVSYRDKTGKIWTRPNMATWVENESGKVLSSTPGVKGGWPYYIAAFISSRYGR